MKYRRHITILITLLMPLVCSRGLMAQDQPINLIRVGIKAMGGATDTSYLSQMTKIWIHDVAEASNTQLQNEPVSLPLNLEYGYQPFLIIRPWRFLRIGLKMDCAYSGSTAKFKNQLTNQDYSLRIRNISYIPGVFAGYVYDKWELGAGVIRAYTSVKLNDGFFGYHDTWHGKNSGWELMLGRSSVREKPVGYSITIKYRALKIPEFKDTYNRQVAFADT
jgi:hypothetical protein